MVSFVNSFLSYLLLMFVIIVVAGCGIALGLFLRKKKDIKAAQNETEDAEK